MTGLLIDFASDFADLLITFEGESYEATTKSSEGRAVAGREVRFTFKATYPQPAGQNDLKLLPEGSLPSSALVIHATTRLHITENSDKADVVWYKGDKYLVMQVNERDALAGNYRTLMRKIQAGE
jgi:hypothetical protein